MQEIRPLTGAVGIEHITRLNILRSTASAHSSRLFKSEKNTQERSALVFMLIRSEITLALFDAGVPIIDVLNNIDPTDVIVSTMLGDGYDMNTQALTDEHADDPPYLRPLEGGQDA